MDLAFRFLQLHGFVGMVMLVPAEAEIVRELLMEIAVELKQEQKDPGGHQASVGHQAEPVEAAGMTRPPARPRPPS